MSTGSFAVPWLIKYRPKKLDHFLCEPSFREMITNFLKNPQHLLLESFTPGTGKTTLAYILINELQADYQAINSSKDRRIEVIRDAVQTFASSRSSKPGIPKIMFLDEADGLTAEAQDALKNLMERYADNCIFILSCNHLQKVNAYLQSRCMVVSMKSAPVDQVTGHLKDICKKEGLVITDDALKFLVSDNHPDMRAMLVKLQELSLSKKAITVEDISNSHLIQKIYDDLIRRNWGHARSIWLDHYISARAVFKIFSGLVDKDISIDESKKKKIFLLLAQYDYQVAVGADSEIQLLAFAIQFIDLL